LSLSQLPPAKTPSPQRVTNDINIPVKRQIRWAKMKKKAAKTVGQSFRKPKVVRTAYRRTLNEEDIAQRKEERVKMSKITNWDVILNQTLARPLVIVDGYNIIYKWSRLKKHMVKGDTQRARQLLVDELDLLRTLHNWRIECVFDGAGNTNIGPLCHGSGRIETLKSPSSNMEISTYLTNNGVRIVFTGRGVEADTYIEKRCFDAKKATNGVVTRSFIVATDDGMIRVAGENAGALCMSASRFVDELKAARKGILLKAEAALSARKRPGEYVSLEETGGLLSLTYGDRDSGSNIIPIRKINGESQRAYKKRLEQEELQRKEQEQQRKLEQQKQRQNLLKQQASSLGGKEDSMI